MADTVPQDVSEFVRIHIASLDQLNVLLLLCSEPRTWSVEEVARALKITPVIAETSLQHLVARTLVAGASSPASAYRFAPATEAVRATVGSLARVRAEQALALTNLMNAQAIERVRQSMLRNFADGFRLRGPRDG